MTERHRPRRRISDLESVEQGLHSKITALETSIAAAQRDRKITAAPDRRVADLRTSELQSSIVGTQREIMRVRNQIRGVEAQLRSLQ